MEDIKDSVAKSARALLTHSFTDINFNYSMLTVEERALITEEEFNELVEWVKS